MVNPAISIQNLNGELASINSKFDLVSVVNESLNTVSQYASSVETKLGTQIGQVVGGFQSLTQELDNIVPTAANAVTGVAGALTNPVETVGMALSSFSQLSNLLNNPLENSAGVTNKGLALLTENPPGMEIRKSTSNQNTALQALTEDTVDGGFLEFTVTAATPEAIANTLQSITSYPANIISSAVETLAAGIVGAQNLISSVIGSVLKGVNTFFGFIDKVTGFISNAIQTLTQGLTGIVNNLIEAVVAPFQSVINTVVSAVVIPIELTLNIKSLIETGFTSQAAELLSPFSDLGVLDIEAQLLNIPTTLGNMIENTAAQFLITTPFNTIGSSNGS